MIVKKAILTSFGRAILFLIQGLGKNGGTEKQTGRGLEENGGD